MNSSALELRLMFHFQTMNVNCSMGFMKLCFVQNPYLNHFMEVTHHLFEYKQHSSDRDMLISFLEYQVKER